jgi:Domain of unknown function (DUF1902)
MYRIGFPGWRLAARCGIPLVLRIDVQHDTEAGVYVATSPDLLGLVVEEKSVEQLFKSVYDCADMLLAAQLSKPLRQRPRAAWTGDFLPA